VTGLRHLAFESNIAAAPESVFAFHERPDAVALLTPWWSGARVVRPAASLQPGERALLVLGRGPLSIEWEAVHEIYEPPTRFVESQVRGPFRRWRHVHVVLPDGSGARLRDELEYELRGGMLAPLMDWVLRPFLRRLFAYRHAITRQSVTAAPHPTRALYLAGEITEDSSINGAIRSGEAAARMVAHDVQP
jgi:ligand-binding SRPBCC domain-containing protein